eukprot:1126071-Alexandrium_andersonii.AAC.1
MGQRAETDPPPPQHHRRPQRTVYQLVSGWLGGREWRVAWWPGLPGIWTAEWLGGWSVEWLGDWVAR